MSSTTKESGEHVRRVCLESSLTLSEETETSCSRSAPEEESISSGPMESGIMHGGVRLRTTCTVCLTRLAFSTPRRHWVAFGSGLCEDTPYPSLKMSHFSELACAIVMKALRKRFWKARLKSLSESILMFSENIKRQPSVQNCQDEAVALARAQGIQLILGRTHPSETSAVYSASRVSRSGQSWIDFRESALQ